MKRALECCLYCGRDTRNKSKICRGCAAGHGTPEAAQELQEVDEVDGVVAAVLTEEEGWPYDGVKQGHHLRGQRAGGHQLLF